MQDFLGVLLFVIVSQAVIHPARITGTGSFLLLNTGDHVILDSLSPHFRGPARGVVIGFQGDPNRPAAAISRVLGLPGETVEFRDGLFYANGEPRAEPYLGMSQ